VKGEQYATDLQCALLLWTDRLEAHPRKITPAVLKEESKSMPETPEDKVESHTMPQSDHQHCRKLT
jgi:hypothetical protein